MFHFKKYCHPIVAQQFFGKGSAFFNINNSTKTTRFHARILFQKRKNEQESSIQHR